MTPEIVLQEGQRVLQAIVLLSAPIMGTTLLIGVFVGMLQAATQINETTISFVPKLMGLAAIMSLAGGWMLRYLVDYTIRLYQQIPGLIG